MALDLRTTTQLRLLWPDFGTSATSRLKHPILINTQLQLGE